MTSQEWHNISRFESYDLAKSWYQETHKRQMNATKTKQINAFFIQGREYFRSASSSDMSVKPLLLYYGVLSLARGAILPEECPQERRITRAVARTEGSELARNCERWYQEHS